MKPTVLVAMSGGVDSSVAAALLKEAGHPVIGVFMRNGVSAVGGPRGHQGCCSVEDALDARRVAEQLDLPFYALDLEDGFQELRDDFLDTYLEGRTPNPCIECNRRFKMGALDVLRRRLGAERLASGHYARIVERGGRRAIARAHDPGKDQSYVLYVLDQEVLGHTLFPLGGLDKVAVREHARRLGLRTAEKAESMEICFVPTGDYRDLLREHRPGAFRRGEIVHEDGRVLGEHEGIVNYTIGQRRGLPGGQGVPLFVKSLDAEANRVVVSAREGLGQRHFRLRDLVWHAAAPDGGRELEGEVRLRHRHAPVAARFLPATATDGGSEPREGRVELAQPQVAITPGQAAVLYDAEGTVLLGGVIASVGEEV